MAVTGLISAEKGFDDQLPALSQLTDDEGEGEDEVEGNWRPQQRHSVQPEHLGQPYLMTQKH